MEEYAFFVIQTALTSLWFLGVLERHCMESRISLMAGSSPYSESPAHTSGAGALARRPSSMMLGGGRVVGIRRAGAGLLLACALVAWRLVLAGDKHCLYMALILGWGLPVLALQWAFGGHVTWRERVLVLNGLAFPTLFLWFADALAIGSSSRARCCWRICLNVVALVWG